MKTILFLATMVALATTIPVPGQSLQITRSSGSNRRIAGKLAASTAASNISIAYVEPETNNILSLRDGATLAFPNTALGSSSSITIVVSNSGDAAGTVASVAIGANSPPVFQLLNLPALPASVAPAQDLRFAVRFSPQQQQAFTGTLLLNVNGRLNTINLQAQATGAQFTYTYGAGPTTAAPGGVISLGDTAVGQTTKVTVSITNGGTADGQISTIAATGTGFSVADLPALPFVLHPKASQTFSLSFTPAQPGGATGRLTIGGDTFTLNANGAGARLIYSYTNTTPVTVTEGGVIIFSPIEVGRPEKLRFSIQNTGTIAATISSINLAAASSSFALEQLPAMPFNLDPNATTTFTLSFTPSTTNALTATLQINSSSFTLSGSGTQPAALPAYQFQSSSNPQPAQQPSIGLTLATPYSVDLAGTLKLTFVSSVFTDDPAIQFATGGRTVTFVIPANSTQALFNGSPSMALQTGTTAGSIVITPSFAMSSGFDVTPPSPELLTFDIPAIAPQLLSGTITSQTTSSFTILLNGFSTTRALRQLSVQLTPKPGQNFSTTNLPIDVATAATAWYQSTASQDTGGSFLAAIPFALQGGNGTDDLVHRLQSVSITATNDAGVSTAITVPIP